VLGHGAVGLQDQRPWWAWPQALRDRHADAMTALEIAETVAIDGVKRDQFRFEQAWQGLRSEARQRGILLFGDLPMFVVNDSADAWSHPERFKLDSRGRALRVAGVPPDDFAAEGQCWDQPVYDWDAMQAQGFAWWLQRLGHECRHFDLLRWDHFRGLYATWEIPVSGSAPQLISTNGWLCRFASAR